MRAFILFILGVLFLCSGCSEPEVVLITGNNPPPDEVISRVLLENYINRAYIDLLGRRPDEAEMSTAYTTLNDGKLSAESKSEVLDEILDDESFYSHQYRHWSEVLIAGWDTATIAVKSNNFAALLANPAYESIWPLLEYEKGRYDLLASVIDDLRFHELAFSAVHRRMVDNNKYDQLNMGSLNLVVSIFQSILLRYPTSVEVENVVNMVDNIPANLFLISGESQEDFYDIFFSSNEYFESQVRDVFLRFLFREPTALEIVEYGIAYRDSENYKELMKTVFSLEEYIGIE